MDDDRERQLAAEEAGRDRVAVSAVAAGALLLAGVIYNTVLVVSEPTVGLIQGLAPALSGQKEAAVDPHSLGLAYIAHHAAGLIFAKALVAAGTVGMILVLRYLYQATRFRLGQAPGPAVGGRSSRSDDVRPRTGASLSRAALILAVAGASLSAICLVAVEAVDTTEAHDFIGRLGRTHEDVLRALNSPPHQVLVIVLFVSQLALAVAFVMIPLNALRAGLLTRFMGVLGIFSGAFVVIIPPLQAIQAFWLVSVGTLLSGRTKQPLPPAWLSGEAEPWPTQQQLRERRQAASEPAPAAPVPAPVPRAPRTTAASKKRKKRR